MKPEGGCWPTAEQELLLSAILSEGPEAVADWERWERRVGLDALDAGSYWLLPLLYRSLRARGVGRDRLSRMKGVYRLVWYRNRLLLARTLPALRALQAAGIETVALKGAALVALLYHDAGLRAMSDLDVLVPWKQAGEAVRTLEEEGWSAAYSAAPVRRPYVHSVLFEEAGEGKLDLHWRVLEESCWPGADDDFLAHAVPVELQGQRMLALAPSDQLVHAIVHGLRWAPLPPLRWVVDAVTLLRAEPVDWDRIVDLAARLRLAHPLLHGLRYLAESRDAPVPETVLGRLARLPTSDRERREYELKLLPVTPGRRLRFHWHNYRRICRGLGRHGGTRDFVGYLQGRWGVASAWALPGFVLAEAWRRATR